MARLTETGILSSHLRLVGSGLT